MSDHFTAMVTSSRLLPAFVSSLHGQRQTKKHYDLVFYGFIAIHVVLWTLLPSLLLENASLDMVEGFAWGHEWQLGYEKDPPLWPWMTELAIRWSGKGLWSVYLLSQLCMATVFFSVWQLGRRIATDQHALVGTLLLEGILYFNFPTPEFNDIVLQLPFAALFGWLLHRALVGNRLADWTLSGLAAGLGLLSRYSMGAYLVPMALFVLLHPQARTCLRSPGPWMLVLTSLLVFLPHLYWIIESDFVSIRYVGHRAQVAPGIVPYLAELFSFLKAQVAACIPMLLLGVLLWRWRSIRAQSQPEPRRFDRLYLATLAFGPVVFSLCLSVITLRPPRDMWGAPLWCFLGLYGVTLIRPVWTADRIRCFGRAWCLALLIPAAAFALAETACPLLAKGICRTQFPGERLAADVTARWQAATHQRLTYVIGDTWDAGNVAFYSDDRPSAYFADAHHHFNPWVAPAALKASGAVLVWDAGRDGTEIPASIARQFPDAVRQPHIEVNGPAKSYDIGVAILFPRPAPEP